MSDWEKGEREARRWIEDQGFVVHDANLMFSANCRNIDLVVYGKRGALYVQTKSSYQPARADCVVVDGSPWNEAQLHQGAPIFNRHDHFKASFVVVVDKLRTGETQFYVAPPDELERLLSERSILFAEKPKRDGTQRSIKFRKELPRGTLAEWRDNWQVLGEPLRLQNM